jgi:glycolate oxidase iron-sulfur subunit
VSGHPQPGEGGRGSRGIFTPELLERCISCGFCLPACPTYQLTKDEDSSPRGRINLMRALEDGTLADDDPTVVEESSFCLGCRACEPVCPAGVRYGAMLEEWRDHTWTRRRRPLKLRALLWAVDRRWRVRAMGAARGHARRGGGDGAAGDGAAGEAPQLMLGCFERALYPKVSRAVRRIAPEVRVTPAQGCCGALHAHNGELERGRELAERLGEELPGPIVTTAGGCAAHLAGMLGRDRVRELSEWLAERDGARDESDGDSADGGEAAAGEKRLRVGLQDSCHLRNGMHVWLEPRALIARVAEYVELPTAASCCGAAGTYATLRPDDSARILDPKLDEIEAADLDVVVAVNPGCLRQLQQGLRRRHLRTRALHLAELLAEHAGAT